MEESPIYVYESPDKGKTIYRRRFLDYDTPRELVKDEGGFLIKENIPDEIEKNLKITDVYIEL